MLAEVRRSINNIYRLYCHEDGHTYQARIKGKVLKDVRGEYNPLTVLDLVEFVPHSKDEGLIVSRLERRSSFCRWNAKSSTNQTICVNMDQVVIVASAQNPPFRPRFIDRAICCVRGADVVIAINKTDLGLDEEGLYYEKLYGSLGFKVVRTSAGTGDVGRLEELLKGKTTAFVGQSGVGKSSLVNVLTGSSERVGEISLKYDRGRHTTNHCSYIQSDDYAIIDTPGVREIMVPFEEKEEVVRSFPEFAKAGCRYDGCLHQGQEGCAVPALVESGEIDGQRYLGYLRILESLDERRPVYMRKKLLEK